MERDEALRRLAALSDQDLRALADKHEIVVFKNGKPNKGWAGHVVERYLGLPLNSAQAPNFGSWELKVVPLRPLRSGVLVVKETMAVTMIDPVEVAAKEFEESHLFAKLRKQVVVARIFTDKAESCARVHAIAPFDLDEPHVFAQVKADYESVRACIRDEGRGFKGLTGKMGVLVQPRTKGAGHGSTSRAFYARKVFVAHILNMARWSGPPVVAEPDAP